MHNTADLSPRLPLVLCIAGPTGVGKTALALSLAQNLPITVINADSRQTYKNFPIITAQPTSKEQSTCPHYLYGYLNIGEPIDVGRYIEDCTSVINKTLHEKRIPLLVGGTGLYIKALFSGVAPIPAIPAHIRQSWENRCSIEGAPSLHKILSHVDPEYAAKIHPNDKQRVTRALEVWEATKKTFSWWHSQPSQQSCYSPIMLGIKQPLKILELTLAKRIDSMIEAGAIEEAQQAIKICSDVTKAGWSGIGCHELYDFITKKYSLKECKDLWLKNTRAYAKRQLTWFNAQKNIVWFDPNESSKLIEYTIRQLK